VSYNFDDLKQAYAKAGVRRGQVVLVKTDLRHLGEFEGGGRTAILNAHFNALADLVDLGLGTIVVSTDSTSLCNTDVPFDLATTKSERGVFTEFVRKYEGAMRSRHPFKSHAAVGAHAERICGNVSRHSGGLETPKDRMLELDAMYVSVGLEPRWTCSYVHQMEQLMGVPYRYTKEFLHPIVQPDGSIRKEFFYLFVTYLQMEVKRNRNVKIFQQYFDLGYTVDKVDVGDGSVWGYSCRDFCKATADYLRQDIYGWMDEPPAERPYQL
jgi:aminoglycoside 3-N-acetyltransferase